MSKYSYLSELLEEIQDLYPEIEYFEHMKHKRLERLQNSFLARGRKPAYFAESDQDMVGNLVGAKGFTGRPE